MRPIRQSIHRILRRLITFAAATWLIIDYVNLPYTAGVHDLLPQTRTRCCGNWFHQASIHRDAAGLSLEFNYELFDESTWIGDASVFDRCHLIGWWAPTVDRYRPTLDIYAEPALTDDEIAFVRSEFVNYFASIGELDFAQWVRDGRTKVDRLLLFGYMRNTLAFLCALLVLIATIRFTRARILSVRTDRRIERGLCSNCAYNLRGARAHRCPECGHAFDPSDPTTFDTGA